MRLPLSWPLCACGSGGGTSAPSEAKGELSYWLWDPNQRPAYQQCADDFHKANPDITVKVTQRGWDDYWATLTNGFVAGNAPDMFTNHLTKYGDYSNQRLMPLDEPSRRTPLTSRTSSKAPPTCGSEKTASATGCRKTGTPSPSSSTRRWPRTPASRRTR